MISFVKWGCRGHWGCWGCYGCWGHVLKVSFFNLCTFSVGGCWCQPKLLFFKVVLIIKMSTFKNFKTTFKYNITFIFLSLRAKFKKTLCPQTPCNCNSCCPFLWGFGDIEPIKTYPNFLNSNRFNPIPLSTLIRKAKLANEKTRWQRGRKSLLQRWFKTNTIF